MLRNLQILFANAKNFASHAKKFRNTICIAGTVKFSCSYALSNLPKCSSVFHTDRKVKSEHGFYNHLIFHRNHTK